MRNVAPAATTATRVLLMDARADSAAEVRGYFAQAGAERFQVEECRSLGDAERRLTRSQPEAILLCVERADDATLSVLRELQLNAPEAPVIVLAGSGDDDLGFQSILHGAQDCLPRSHLDAQGLVRCVRFAIERKRAERRLAQLASTDPLTGLPNRLGFISALTRAIERSKRSGLPFTVMFIDVDHFKQVNDSLGHAAGDRLLRLCAERLQDCLREGDTVARLGGDEFVVLAEALMSDEDAAIVAGRVCAAIAAPFDVGAREVCVSSSVGVALYPADAPDVDQLLRRADEAMYRAKKAGGNGFEFFAAEREGRLPSRMAMESRLRRALGAREFTLHYQPQVDVQSGEVVCVEALIRWRREDASLTPPDVFVPLLEETGLILPVGDWVLRAACEQLAAWRAAGLTLRLAVNVSARQLRSAGLADDVERILAEHGLPPSALELELTEGLLIENTEIQRHNLERLRALGVHISLDDFGTGYSSLSYLRHLPIDSLKIDRSFIGDVARDAKARAIGKTIVELAHCMELRVVAEGVETHEQLEFLAAQGCDLVQGFYLGYPMPAGELEDWLRERHQALAA